MLRNYKNISIHLLVWPLLFIFFFSIDNYFYTPKNAAFSALVQLSFSLFVYFTTTQYLFPKYYNNLRRYLIYALIFTLLVTGLYLLIDTYVLVPRHTFTLKEIPLIFPLIRLFTSNGLTFFVGTSIKLMQHNNRLKENEKLLTEEKLKTELKLLKAQINPHFIFNALNNIYSLTYMKAKNAPDSVLKLSEMLRYVFYDCSSEKVNLNSELKYIENFIAFQQMKSDFSQNIKLSVNTGNGQIEIAPMLFIPFIENAFKYSRIEDKEEGFVNISIVADNKRIQFEIENNIELINKPLAGSGTGIKNVQHRLGIIYPESHVLDISEQSDKYNVNLVIES